MIGNPIGYPIGGVEVAAGATVVSGAGAAAGTSTVTGVGAENASGVGSSAGTSADTSVGAALYKGVGSVVGTSTVSGVGTENDAATASASGTATVTGVGTNLAHGLAAAAGIATVAGIGSELAAASGVSVGTSLVEGLTGEVSIGTGSSSGTSKVEGVGFKPGGARGGSRRRPIREVYVEEPPEQPNPFAEPKRVPLVAKAKRPAPFEVGPPDPFDFDAFLSSLVQPTQHISAVEAAAAANALSGHALQDHLDQRRQAALAAERADEEAFLHMVMELT